MANKTVYPYGAGGSLPSSIGLINDLATGGADNALAAEQGKVVGDYLFGNYRAIDLSEITEQNFSLGANTTANNKWTTSGKHKAVPVTPGSTIKISTTSVDTDGGFYSFFTSSYTVPTATSSAVYYASGCSRWWQNISYGETEKVVPNDAAYLIICTIDGSGGHASWSVSVFDEPTIKNDYLRVDSDKILADVNERVDLSEIENKICSLGASLWIYKNDHKQRHKVIDVTPGLKLRVRATASTSTGNFRAFLTSSYVSPSGADGVIPYVAGTGRTWQYEESGWVDITCPANSAYLCLTTVNGDGDSTEWDVIKVIEVPIREAYENYSLTKDTIVNNCIDGGVDSPLSAEMGKELYSMITDGIPNGVTKHVYNGAPVKISSNHYVGCKKVSSVTSQNFQGGACYGNYLFMFTENNTTCWIYNLATSTLLQTYTIPSEQRGFVSNCHCNTANFGTEKYDSGDQFPLLYVSTGYASDGYSGVLVYRVVASTSDDVTTYSLSLVQTLKIPGTSWTEFIVGGDGDCYIKQELDGIRYYRMKMPTLSQGDYTFDLDDALHVCLLTPQPSWYNGSRNQGHLYLNGKMYLASGVPTSEASLFIVIDLATGRREVEIDLYNTLGLTSEPEAIFVWNGQLCIVFRSNTNVYAIYFE